MSDPDFLWFIEEIAPNQSPEGRPLSNRLNYGPFDTPEEADSLVRDLRRQPRFRLSDLIVSKQRRREP